MNNHYIAETGKTFKSKLNGNLVGDELYLGIQDCIDNYEQVDLESNETTINEQPSEAHEEKSK